MSLDGFENYFEINYSQNYDIKIRQQNQRKKKPRDKKDFLQGNKVNFTYILKITQTTAIKPFLEFLSRS